MPVIHDPADRSIVVSNDAATLSLRIRYEGKCVIDQLTVRGKQVLAQGGLFSAAKVDNELRGTFGTAQSPAVSVDGDAVTIAGIRFGEDVLPVEEQWKFNAKSDRIFWAIERTYARAGTADEVLLPVWNFPSVSDWTAGILGTGGAAWFRLFDSTHATYGVHTDSVLFWDAGSRKSLRIVARTPPGSHVAVRFSRHSNDELSSSFAITGQEVVPRYDIGVNRRRYLTDREDMWEPCPVSGTVEVEYELSAPDFDAEHDRGSLKHFDKDAIQMLMNTIARIGVIDKYLHGSNSWRTPFGPVCLHEQFIAQMGLALNDERYLEAYRQTLNSFRDHGVQPDGRVKARWAYTSEDAMPGTSDETGFYEAQWGILLDSNPDYVTNVAELFNLTGDREWVRGQKETCEHALEFILKRDSDSDGLVEMMTDSHTQKRGSDWIDVVWASHRNAFVNAKLYYALGLWAGVEEVLGDEDHAKFYRNAADRLKRRFNEPTSKGGFWDAGHQWYVYWLDQDGSVHGNNLVIPVNFMAIAYGICDDSARASAILKKVEQLMVKEDLFAWPLCMYSFAPGEAMEFQYPFPNYENGDIFLAWGEVGTRAYASHDPAIAVKYIDRLLAQYKSDGLAFQRYSRSTQKGLGNDILANNCLTIVGLYRNIYGVQPKYNRLYLEPHITKELDGTILKYRWRGKNCTIRLNMDGQEMQIDGFSMRASASFAMNVGEGRLEYFRGESDKAFLILETQDPVQVTIEEWEMEGRGVKKWTERCTSTNASVNHAMRGLKPGSTVSVYRNGKFLHSLRADEEREVRFEVRGGYEKPQQFEVRADVIP